MTPSSAHAATAASAAVPPARITSIAVSAARGCDVATIAFWAWTVERPARWKFLMPGSFFQSVRILPKALAPASLLRPAGVRCDGLKGFLAYSSPPGQWLAYHQQEWVSPPPAA